MFDVFHHVGPEAGASAHPFSRLSSIKRIAFVGRLSNQFARDRTELAID
jgi:hypothetical protein